LLASVSLGPTTLTVDSEMAPFSNSTISSGQCRQLVRAARRFQPVTQPALDGCRSARNNALNGAPVAP
jgi:hypothetical protein